MTIAVAWDSEDGQIIRLTFDREWSWDDLANALTESAALHDPSAAPIGLLILVPPQVRLPSMFLSSVGPFIAGDYPVGIHTLVVVTPDLLSEVMMRAVFRVYGAAQARYTMHMATTANEARAIIAKRAHELGLG